MMHGPSAIHDEENIGKVYDAHLMARLLQYLRPYRRQVVTAVVLLFLVSLLELAGPFLTKVAIDRYLDPSGRPSSPTPWGPSRNPLATPVPAAPAGTAWERLLPPPPPPGEGRMEAVGTGLAAVAGFYLLALALRYACQFAQVFVMQWTGQKVMLDLRMVVFSHMQRLPLAWYDRNPVGRSMTRVTTDVDVLNELFTSGVVSVFGDVFTLAGIVLVMLQMDWRMALATFTVLPIIVGVTELFRRAVRESYRRVRVAVSRINAFTQERLTAVAVVQLFNREGAEAEGFARGNAENRDANLESLRAYALFYPTIDFLGWLAIAVIVWYGGGLVSQHAASLGTVVAFIQYSQRFYRPIADMSEKFNILQAAMAASERIFRLLDEPAVVESPPQPRSFPGMGPVEFRNVWFAYRGGEEPEASDWVLRDVSFTIEPGQCVAVVGHTGAGKTTLIHLLMRFYDVQKGQVLLNGVDIRELDLAELRRHFAVVGQDPFLFAGTIESNIRLGSAHVDDAAVHRAATVVGLEELVQSLEGGWQAPVHERGSTLSSGQRQLVSFARALAHDADFLILDEATSSVDTRTEQLLQAAMDRLMRSRTSLVVAHRLSTIRSADHILVVHHGRLVEQGTHEVLLAHGGVYSRLYELQYREQEVAAPSDS